MLRLLLTSVMCLLAAGCNPPPPEISNDRLAEGVYATPDEISGFSGTTLELKDGKFRYWFYTDVVDPDEPGPEFPITGEYEFQDGQLQLKSNDVNQQRWHFDVLKGTPVLWRDDAYHIWKERQDIFPYGILIWTAQVMHLDGPNGLQRVSVIQYYSEEKQKKIRESIRNSTGSLIQEPQ
ncbi:hypothetical protein [uncultured Gimesia sp.]|jgi:hypothetical protein|uniref:hypothetical protein n=1 Tax=uncultured Gimesia sp. TaxID=1678688 RepID=UPI00260A4B74|nr:hypothetical protein [uncultured Gimesia sp.]